MKTPDEIKKGLALHRSTLGCDNICPYDGWNAETGSCIQRLMKDTVEYIEHLETRLAQVERERDALMESVKGCCETCAFVGDCTKHDPDPTSTGAWWYDDCEEWQWRGVCPENTKEEN